MKKENAIRGRILVIQDLDGKQIDNIDTDMIFHNKHLAITNIDEMGQYIFGNLDNWEDFPQKVEKGDIVVVGKNFGSGSSRQQAVDGFIALGVSAIIGESFGAIYWRNAVNAGLPVIRADGIMQSDLKSEENIEVDLASGEISRVADEEVLFKAEPMSRVQIEMYKAGGLFEYSKEII